MKKYLVLIDEKFPFDNSESFLETEIEYLNNFNEIFICPCSENAFLNLRNIKNHKVMIIKLIDKHHSNKLVKAMRYFFAVFQIEVIKEVIKLFKNGDVKLSIIKELLSFVSVGNEKYKEIKKELNKKNIGKKYNIIFYSYWMDFHAYIGVKLKKNYPESKAISRCHRFDLYEYTNKNNYIPLRKFIIKNLDTVYCISNDGKQYLENKYGDIGKNIEVSPLGTRDNGIRHVDLNRKPFKIVSCSWISPVKRVDKIIGALSKIKDMEVEWTHIGDGVLFNEIKNNSAEYLPGNVKFNFLGALANREVQRIYKENDYHIFINVSESEGIPVSIMEAISFGMPVIATDVGGVSEIVKDRFNGFLLQQSFQDKELIKCIKDFYQMSEIEYLKFRENARNFWMQNFNAEENYKKFANSVLERFLIT